MFARLRNSQRLSQLPSSPRSAAWFGEPFPAKLMLMLPCRLTRTEGGVLVHQSSVNARALARTGEGGWVGFQTMLLRGAPASAKGAALPASGGTSARGMSASGTSGGSGGGAFDAATQHAILERTGARAQQHEQRRAVLSAGAQTRPRTKRTMRRRGAGTSRRGRASSQARRSCGGKIHRCPRVSRRRSACSTPRSSCT